MAKAQTQRKSGGSRKIGRNKEKCALYATRRRRFKNKLRRIEKSEGEGAANYYKDTAQYHSSRYLARHPEAKRLTL